MDALGTDDWWYEVSYDEEFGWKATIFSQIEYSTTGIEWDGEFRDSEAEAHCAGYDYCLVMSMMERS